MLAKYQNLKLIWKVLVAPAFLILFLIGVGAFALYIQRDGQNAVAALMSGPVAQAEAVSDFNSAALRSQVRLYRLMATAANETDPKKIKVLSTNALTALKEMSAKLDAITSLKIDNTKSAKAVAELKKVAAAYAKQAGDVIDMADGDAGSAMMLMGAATRSFATIENVSEDLIDSTKDFRDQKIAMNNVFAEREQMLLVGTLGLAVIVGGVASLLIGRGIAKPISAIVPELNKLADGDFNITLSSLGRKDEIGQISTAVEMVVEKVGSAIGNIKIAATEVTSASAEISTSTTDLSQRTEEQAASLEETSAAMEQMASTVKKNADNARQANSFAGETNEVAERGGAVVDDAVRAMAKIEESSRKISDIIGVIDEIARQTNLLALNAAVEAARAGEAGRGFAVVASEVRSLAQRSAQAAKDIKILITNSNSQVKDGVDLVNKAGISLQEIVASIQKVTAIVQEISSASLEQATGIEEINRALSQMDDTTQQNSALVEENAATAKTLEEQAKSMDERVASFRLRGVLAHEAGDGVSDDRPAIESATITATIGRDNKTMPARGAKRPVAQMRTTAAAVVKNAPDWKEF